MSIDIRQLNQEELSGFVSGMLTGLTPDIIAAYLSEEDIDFGSNVVYVSGSQTISGQKTFTLSPTVPYSGTTGQAVSMQYVLDRLTNVQVQGFQTFSGGMATSYFYVPTPTNASGAVNLSFLNSGYVSLTGNQTVSGNKTFTGNIYVPTATGGWQALPYNQFASSISDISARLDSVEAAHNTSGFGGVLSFNGQSGNIFSQGLGNITVSQVGNIFKISGAIPTGTGYIQGAQGPMGPYLNYKNAWNTGVTYSYLDWVTISGVSWAALTGHLSTTGNRPYSGNSYWGLLASGTGAKRRARKSINSF